MTIERKAIAGPARMTFLPSLFGEQMMMRGEALLFRFADEMLPDDYSGGYWEFMKAVTSDGSFRYAVPSFDRDPVNLVVAGNGFAGMVTGDTAGIIITAFALGAVLSMIRPEALDEQHPAVVAWDTLRAGIGRHPERKAIWAALD